MAVIISFQLNIAISELESKDHFRCTWLNKHREETVLSLYVAKNVTIAELLEEAKKQVIRDFNELLYIK